MKAWELSGFGLQNLRLTDKPVPEPAANEVLVRIDAVSLNYRDKLIYAGLYNPNLRLPVVQGADAAGEIVGIGKHVTRFRAGDRVVTHYATRWLDGEPQGDESVHTLGNTISGSLAEFVALDEHALVAKPQY